MKQKNEVESCGPMCKEHAYLKEHKKTDVLMNGHAKSPLEKHSDGTSYQVLNNLPGNRRA
jgi:hypothetical protein